MKKIFEFQEKYILVLNLAFLSLSQLVSVYNGRILRHDISGHLFLTLEFNKIFIDGLRFFDSLFLIPALLVRNLLPDDVIVSSAIYTTGLSLISAQYLSLYACYNILKKNNLNPNFIYFPILSFSAGTLLASNWASVQTHSISMLFWPIVFLYLVEKKNMFYKIIHYFLIVALSLTHEAAIYSLAVLLVFYCYDHNLKLVSISSLRKNRFIALLTAIGALCCILRTFTPNAYLTNTAHLSNYLKFFDIIKKDPSLFSQTLLLMLFMIFTLLQIKITRALQVALLFITSLTLIYNIQHSALSFFSDLYRIFEPIIVALLGLLFFYVFKNKFILNSKILIILLTASLLNSFIREIHHHQEWSRNTTKLNAIAKSSNQNCIELIKTKENFELIYTIFPIQFLSILLQKSKTPEYIVFTNNSFPICENLKKEKAISFYHPANTQDTLILKIPLNKENSFFNFEKLIN